jgi:Tfp pilus assembly protein PilV
LADVVYGRVRTTDPDKRPGPVRLRARCAAACAALGSRLRSEAGSALIEVMVGAVVLSIATVGLLNGIDGAQSTGGKNKARSVAAALAEQDIERMRAMPVTQLPGYNNTRTVTVRGVNYTVVSKGSWAVDAGGPISCSNISRTAANVRIVSEVTSNATKGVVDQVSLVTPPPGTYATGEGRAIVKVTDKDGDPVQSMGVTLSGTASFGGTTNSLGCAVFPFIPIGNYTAAPAGGGYVDYDGDSTPTQGFTVNQSQSTAVNFIMDNAATIQGFFDTVVGTTTINAQSRWLTVANSKLIVGTRLFTAGGTSPATATQINATSLFPFNDGYSVYPGQCTANIAGAKTYTPTPGQILSTATNKLRLPSINIHVVNSSGTNTTGATVMIEPSDYPTCPNVFPTQLSTNTTAGGSAALPNPGFPYGTYKLCAQNSAGTLHGHADQRTGISPGSYGTGHVDDTINNATGGNNQLTATSLNAIRIMLNQTGPCHGFPQNGFP